MKKIYQIICSAVLSASMLVGCNKDFQEPMSNQEQVAAAHLAVVVTGLQDTPITMFSDGEKYVINESGRFERDAYDAVHGVMIAEEPEDAYCTLLEQWGDRSEKMASCVPKTIDVTETNAYIGNGWTYAINGNARVMYSPESVSFTPDENGSLIPRFAPILPGTFFDDGGTGNTFIYTLPGAAIGDLSKYALDQAMLDVLQQSEEILHITRVYTYESDVVFNSEYFVQLRRPMRSAEVVAELSQHLHNAVLTHAGNAEASVGYVPAAIATATASDQFRIATTVYPYSELNCFYAIKAAPDGIMGESHFPTTSLTNASD